MKKVVAYWLTAVLALSWVVLPGIVEQTTVHAQAAAPELRRIGPEVVTAGAPQFTIRIEGRNLSAGSDVLFDGAPLPQPRTTKKGKFMFAEVPPSLVATPGTHTIQVRSADGMTSAQATLTVVAQDPNIFIRLPLNSVQEDSGLIFVPEIRGQGFEEGLKVFVWRKAAPSFFINESRAEIEINENLTTEPARIPITLRNEDGGYSNTEIFYVVPRPARIQSLEPFEVEAGSEDFEMKVFGDFKADARVLINGQEVEIAERRSARIDVIVPASLVAAPARLIVRVEQDGIQSRDEILTVNPVTGPFIFAITPNRVRIGEGRTVIDIIGANLRNTTVLIDGQEANIRDSGGRRLVVRVPDALLETPGTRTVQVVDNDENASEIFTLEVAADVTVSTLAGARRDGFNQQQCVSADEALMRRPRRITLAEDGLLYFTDQQNHAIRTINPTTGEVCTVAGTGLEGYKDSGNPLGDPPVFSYPNGVAVASDGTIYVTENGNSVVRRILRAGGQIAVDTFAGRFTEIASEDRQKKFNSTQEGLLGFRSDQQLESEFRLPDDIIIASDGTIYIADAGNHSVRRIRNGVVETIAGNGVAGFADGIGENARFNTPTAIVLSDDGRFLFVADTFNNRIRVIDLLNNTVGTLTGNGDLGVANGPPGEASLSLPVGLALDDDGVLYVAELGAHDIRRVDAFGNVSTLAGDGTPRHRDGPGVTARFNSPRGLAIDRASGMLFVADYENHAIRKIELR